MAVAQRAEKSWRIGFLRVGPPPAAFIGGFQKGLREQGLVEGRHFVIEYAIAKNQSFGNKIAADARHSGDVASPTAAQYVEECEAAARNLGIGLIILNERDPGDIDRLFSALKGADALVIADDAEFTADRTRIAELALKMHLPTISGLRELAEAGGLIAYGASFGKLYRRAVSHVHKILQGTNPSDLPVEQPAKFELVLNMQTAKAIDIAIPPSVLARADEVIE